MYPLLALSFFMWLLIIVPSVFLGRLYRKNMALTVAKHHLQENRYPDPKIYRGVVALLLTQFISRRSGNKALDAYILNESVIGVNHSLSGYLTCIGVLVAIAPLLGLLGTVTGMISTFDVLAIFGTGNSKAMASGISEALITTQTGLLMAVPGLYMKNFLARRAENLQHRVATTALYLQRHL